MNRGFAAYHPSINFLYFTAVLVGTMFLMHPLCLIISLGCSMLYSLLRDGKKRVKMRWIYLLPTLLVASMINPLFNHEGITILGYFKSGNPLTLESILYGMAAASMLGAIINWFGCYNSVMTTDKFIYLFGRIIPSFSLVLTMVLRFIPVLKLQLQQIIVAQQGIGQSIDTGNIIQRARKGIRILSILITYTLENAIETADAMNIRGYGLPGRTAFSIYKFDKRDKKLLVVIGGLIIGLIVGGLRGNFGFQYFPMIKGTNWDAECFIMMGLYFILCSMPIVVEVREDYRWKCLKSKI